MTGKYKNIRRSFIAASLAALLLLCVSAVFAQSTNLEFPTPVTSGEIRGRIRARDLGDSRMTSHYYLFEAENGDVLLNIESSNLNGDIDIYTAGSLKPLLKASVYAVGYATAMQREIYLRLPSRLILRVEGRTPNDDPAEYRIRFSGVFKPMTASSVPKNPGDPRVTGSEASEGAVARVNSVGTIIEEIKPPPPKEEPKKQEPKKEPPPKTTVAKNTVRDKPKIPSAAVSRAKTPEIKEAKPKPADTKPKTVSSSGEKSSGETKPKTTTKTADKTKTAPPAAAASKKPPTTTPAKLKSKPVVTVDSSKLPTDPLAGVFLVIKFKDDSDVRYAMGLVERVNVNNGMLTVVLKNGGILRRPLIDVAEMKIGQ